MNYKETLDDLFKNVKFDKALLTKVNNYKVGILNKNQDHIEFFSGNLTGVQILRFTSQQDYLGFFNIFNVTPDDVIKAIEASSFFNLSYEVEGDPFNHLCLYVSHRFLTSPLLDKKDREIGGIEGGLIFLIRVIIILINARFTYQANIDVARQVYEALSHKFLIKQYKDWNSVLYYQSEKSVGVHGLHRNRILSFDKPEDVRYILSNMQTSMSSLIKGIYSVLIEMNNNKDKINKSSMTGNNMSGEMEFKEFTGNEEAMINSVTQALGDVRTIINEDLLILTKDVLKTCDTSKLKDWIKLIAVDQFKNPEVRKLSSDFAKHSILYCANYATREKLHSTLKHDYGAYLHRIRTGILSAKSQDSSLLSMRDIGFELISHYYPHMSLQNKSSLRTGLCFYLYLYSLTKVSWGK